MLFFPTSSQNELWIGEKSIESWELAAGYCLKNCFVPNLRSKAFVWFNFWKTTQTSLLWPCTQIEKHMIYISTGPFCILWTLFICGCKRYSRFARFHIYVCVGRGEGWGVWGGQVSLESLMQVQKSDNRDSVWCADLFAFVYALRALTWMWPYRWRLKFGKYAVRLPLGCRLYSIHTNVWLKTE